MAKWTPLNLQDTLTGWLPVTVVKGGGTANSLVTQFESKWGRTLMGKTLIRNIAQSLYRDNKSLEKQMRSNVRPSDDHLPDTEHSGLI